MPRQSHVAIKAQRTTGLGTVRNLLAPPAGVNIGLLERLASLAVGATLILITVRRFMLYLGLGLVGGYFVYRGITGYCPLYAAEQIDTRNLSRKLLAIARSKHYEQDNSTRQMATSPWHSENQMGQTHRR